MKTKTYRIEVVRTSTVEVTLPISFDDREVIASWENGLWDLESGIDSIAEYAAHMAVEHPSGNHDGIGKLLTSSWETPDFNKNKYQIKAVIVDDNTETDILSQEGWVELQPA